MNLFNNFIDILLICTSFIMPLKFPVCEKCCWCVTDLKTAAAIIAVLGIVTSPAVSWAVVRHSHVIRVSCFLTKSATRPDIVDINLTNILSFGFGANAGLEPSCLAPRSNTTEPTVRNVTIPNTSQFVVTVKYIGWLVLTADVVFLCSCVYFLISLYKGSSIKSVRVFIYSAVISIILSFIYGMLYVAACTSVGGAFPIFEFAFSFVDILLWTYFLIVVHSYRLKESSGPISGPGSDQQILSKNESKTNE